MEDEEESLQSLATANYNIDVEHCQDVVVNVSSVRTNDVDGYIHVLSSIIEICFAFNHPNYARWGSFFSTNYSR